MSFDEFLVSDIRIIGLQRVSTGSIFNVIPISVGDRIDLRKSSDIVRSLFSTEPVSYTHLTLPTTPYV